MQNYAQSWRRAEGGGAYVHIANAAFLGINSVVFVPFSVPFPVQRVMHMSQTSTQPYTT
jgi:hypothetical protein